MPTHSPRPIALCLAAAFVLCGGIHRPASSQVVQGRLVDAVDDAGIGGAMVSLVDRSGNELSRVLSRDSGLFQLSTAIPGAYRLRADRIGYATTFSDYFDLAAGDTLSLRMVAAVQAVSLKGISAEGDRRCRVRPEDGLAVTRVWDEARKALAAAAWTQERGYYRYEMMRITRQLGREGRQVVSEDRSYDRSYRQAPYVSRPAEELIENGFAQLSASESVYWAPDADVLLSDAFLDTHCFRLKEDGEDGPGLVGLEFEPVPGRRLAEIGGTLWLGAESSQLERLDFQYRNLNLPDALLGADIGGTVEFQGLPNGTWIVDSWRIRMPRGTTKLNPLDGRIMTILEGLTVQGGDVLKVVGNEGTVLETNVGGRIAGFVFDSLRAALPGARVFVEGTGIEVTTDRQGRFELLHLDPGLYSVTYSHPYMERYSYRPEPFEVEVAEGAETAAQLNFAAPRVRRILDRLCQDEEQPGEEATIPGGGVLRNHGVLIGRVTDGEGNPLAGARVRVLARAFDISSIETRVVTTEMRAGRSGVAVLTNASGYYRACWVPVDTELDVAVLEPDQELDPNTLQVGYHLSDLISWREERVLIDSDSGFATLNLRVEPK
ncbi:MAG: carboxypeptidase-like regulatory domain-containing protein [Gemmatimonadetes bacterium]|nr:carboxypeptidase-like regulatory domain-containing protein [Gemmatimonadota bacterium]